MKLEWRNCFKCNYEAITQQAHCPRCRKMRLRNAGEIRLLGVLLALLGTILLVMMSAISVVCAGLIYAPQKPGSNIRFTGTNVDIAVAFGFFAVVLAIGFFFTAAGVWQIIFGRRNRVLLWLGITLGLTLLIAGELILAIVQNI
jgi:uncharacterized paraquat-inducible protein A